MGYIYKKKMAVVRAVMTKYQYDIKDYFKGCYILLQFKSRKGLFCMVHDPYIIE